MKNPVVCTKKWFSWKAPDFHEQTRFSDTKARLARKKPCFHAENPFFPENPVFFPGKPRLSGKPPIFQERHMIYVVGLTPSTLNWWRHLRSLPMRHGFLLHLAFGNSLRYFVSFVLQLIVPIVSWIILLVPQLTFGPCFKYTVKWKSSEAITLEGIPRLPLLSPFMYLKQELRSLLLTS